MIVCVFVAAVVNAPSKVPVTGPRGIRVKEESKKSSGTVESRVKEGYSICEDMKRKRSSAMNARRSWPRARVS
jgi:hypothetical protein